MAGRRTNLALLVLLGSALLTGGLAFAVGTPLGAVPVVAHGLAGFAIVLLAPWKSLIVRRGIRRFRPGVSSSVVLIVLVTIAVVSGVLFSTGLVLHYGPLTAMQVHVGSALLTLPIAARHVWLRPVRPRRVDLNRRNALRAGALLGSAGLVYVGLEGLMRLGGWPGRNRRYTGSYERGSFRPQAMPVTQWFDDSVQQIDARGWKLDIRAHGRDRSWTYEDLTDFDDVVIATLDCTGGWFATQEWSGVWLERLLGEADGRSILVTSASGYSRRYPRRDASKLLLATGMGGEQLSPGHGYPLRVVAPGRRGFWWVKWVTEISVEDRPWWVQLPFPIT